MDLSKFTFKRLVSSTYTFQEYFDIKAEFEFLDEENKTDELLELRTHISASDELIQSRTVFENSSLFENVNLLEFIKKYGFITLRNL